MIKEKSMVMEKNINKTTLKKKSNSNEVEMEKEVLDVDNEPIENVELMDASTIIVDRDEEDRDIAIFSRYGRYEVAREALQKPYSHFKKLGKQTLLSRTITSVEDLFEELSFVFVKAAQKYERKRGNFNNCLFTFLINRLKNIRVVNMQKESV